MRGDNGCIFRKTGAGTLVMTDTYSTQSGFIKNYPGANYVDAGTLCIAAANSVGTGAIYVRNGAAVQVTATVSNPITVVSGTLEVPEGASATLGNVNGTGTAQIDGTATIADGATWSIANYEFGESGSIYVAVQSSDRVVATGVSAEVFAKFTSGGKLTRSDEGEVSFAAVCEWMGATDSNFATPGNWGTNGTPADNLANMMITLSEGDSQSFTYVGYDPVSLTTTTFVADGTATFPDVGGLYLSALTIGATGKIVYDPTKFTFRLVSAPVFESGAKIALASKWASNTKGRFLLMTWDSGSLDTDEATLTAVFDTTSAQGTDVKIWAENLTAGGRLWLDLDYSATKEQINVLCVGDSITHGLGSQWGNWRTGLMKKLAANGYRPVAKGHWSEESVDICGAAMPDDWTHHCGIGGQHIETKGGGGTVDAIEAMLDQAGDVDFVLMKLGTNDLDGNSSTAEYIFPIWKELVWKVLNQKPHAKFVAGSVIDMAFKPTKNAQVVLFNSMISNAIASAEFPAKRMYFADHYNPCYRYDANDNYITGSFYTADNLHPDWPNEDKMADIWCAKILEALAEDPDFELGAAETDVPTTSGCTNNIPARFRLGFKHARTIDIAANTGTTISGSVPYSYVNENAPTTNLKRVGYYIELKRKNDAQSDFHGLTRWMWVSMDAFGDKTIDTVGVPLTKTYQGVVSNLRIKTNMPGIESTAGNATNVTGWVEFWPSGYGTGGCGAAGAPTDTIGYDWNDKRSDGMSGWGSMQVHRLTPGERNPAQVMFAFNHWTAADGGAWEIGLGNFSHQYLGSIDWTLTSDTTWSMVDTMTAKAYEVAKIEIWTSDTPDPKGMMMMIFK